MTGVPKKRISSARQGNRRSHHHLTPPPLMDCTQCRQPKLQHHVCSHCGYYHGRQVLEVGTKERRGTA